MDTAEPDVQAELDQLRRENDALRKRMRYVFNALLAANGDDPALLEHFRWAVAQPDPLATERAA